MKLHFFRLTIAILVLAAAYNAEGQDIITTYAGLANTTGWTGDGGPASAAALNNPSDLAFDKAGNLYVTDFLNNVIRKINPSGIITTFAGNGFGASSTTTGGGGYTGDGGPATAAELNGPFGLAIDAAGNVYFADGYNHAVRKVSATGTITTFAGKNATGYTGDGGQATAALLNNPVGVAIDKAGNVYIADDHNNAIRKVYVTTGIISTVAGGNVVAGRAGDGGPATAAELSLPIGVAFDTAGNMFIADSRNNVIRKVNATTQVISTFAGGTTRGYTGDGGLAVNAKLDSPERISFDNANNLYISDYYNNVIRKVDAVTGIITTVAGDGTGAGTSGTGAYGGDDGPATAAQLHLPHGVAFDASHRMYIADRANQLIRRVGPAPIIDHTGVNTLTGNHAALLVAYPNPAHAGALSVKLLSGASDDVSVSITNILGQTVHKFTTVANQETKVHIDAPAGLYMITATNSAGTWSQRISVE